MFNSNGHTTNSWLVALRTCAVLEPEIYDTCVNQEFSPVGSERPGYFPGLRLIH